MAMLVRTMPIERCRGTECVDVAACRSPTDIILNAPTKHFAMLSKYLSMNDTTRPHTASTAIVAYAARLNPSKRADIPLDVCVKSDKNPKQTPKK